MLSKLYCLRRVIASTEANSSISDNETQQSKKKSHRILTQQEASAVHQVRKFADEDELPDERGSWQRHLQNNKLGFAGMGLWVGLVAFFLLRVKKRQIPLQVYLIQLRVGAQIVCVGCIAAGATYGMYFKDSP